MPLQIEHVSVDILRPDDLRISNAKPETLTRRRTRCSELGRLGVKGPGSPVHDPRILLRWL